MSRFRSLAVPVLLALTSATLLAQSGDLTNGIVSATFTLHGKDVQLTRLQNLKENLVVDLAPAGPHFVAALEPDPSAPTWRADQRVLVRSSDVGLGNVVFMTLPPGFFKPGAPAGQLMALVFGPVPITPPPSSGQAPFLFIGAALWRLYDGAETFDASFLAAIIPLTTTTYRTWRVNFPTVDVPKLSARGGDSLLTGAFGGILFSQPIDRINLQWPDTGLNDPDFNDYQVLAADPGAYAVPVLAYMDSDSRRCVYFSTDDERGTMKQLRANAMRANDLLRLSAGLLPAKDVFRSETFEAEHWIQIGLVKGDHWDVAERYRNQMASFRWYPGPAGSSTNKVVPPRLKGSAVHVVQDIRMCPYGKTTFPTAPQLEALVQQLKVLKRWFGPGPLAQVDWSRFAIHEWTEVSNAGFTPAQPVSLAPYVSRLSGTGIVDRSFTEGLLPLWCENNCFTCLNPLRPPLITAMIDENKDAFVPDGSKRHFACPAGKGRLTGIDFPAWVVKTQSGALRSLGLSGFTWTAPGFYAAPCFAKDHDHAPGFGSWCSQAWLAMSRDIRAAVPNGSDLTVMMETSSAFFGQEVSVQNDWSFAMTPPGFSDPFDPVKARRLWHGLPIRSIPLFNAVADHVKLGSVYHGASLAMPYTAIDTKIAQQDQYFVDFPAVTGAMAAWSQAVRALARRGMVLIGLHDGEDLAAMETPGDDPTQRAQADLAVFLRRLAGFLQGDGAPFHSGTLVRPPVVTVTNDTERFVLPLTPFPKLSVPLRDFGITSLDFAEYSPVNSTLQGLVGREWLFKTIPEETPTFLPGGMYRSIDGRLGWLVANPFGVNHLFGPVGQRSMRTLNPFTFDYSAPAASPETAYDYRVQIDPRLYRDFLKSSGKYTVEVVTYTASGIDRRFTGALSGTFDQMDRLEPFEVRGYFLTAQ